MNEIQLDISLQRMLLVDWFARIGTDLGMDFTHSGGDEQAFRLGPSNGSRVMAYSNDSPPYLDFVASDSAQQGIVDTIVFEAIKRVESLDFGSGVWYSTSLPETEYKLEPHSPMASLMGRVNSQVSITGWRRLDTQILLEFTEIARNNEGKQSLLAPRAVVHVHIKTPGPCDGFFSSHLAHYYIEHIGAICTFALGRPVELPYKIFSSQPEEWDQLNERQMDPTVLYLARKGVSLGVFGFLASDGGLEVFNRIRNTLITITAAQSQKNDSVACILYVVAAESLTVPFTEWRHSKLTKRFIEFFDELMPSDLDEIVAHGELEKTLGIKLGHRSSRALRRELLSHVVCYPKA